MPLAYEVALEFVMLFLLLVVWTYIAVPFEYALTPDMLLSELACRLIALVEPLKSEFVSVWN